MLDAAGAAGLLREAGHHVLPPHELLAQHLDRDLLIDALIEGGVDHPHAALSELALQAVSTGDGATAEVDVVVGGRGIGGVVQRRHGRR